MNRLMLTMAAAAIAAIVSVSPASAQTGAANAPQATTGTPQYEWQYHYVGRHARYVGHWVRVR